MSTKRNSSKTSGNITAGIAVVASIAPLIKPAIDAARDYAGKAIEARKKLVGIPKLYSHEYPLTAEQAVDILENCGLKATLIKTSTTDAAPKYRNCFPSQVIKTGPAAGKKVERGTNVCVKYITQDIIDESQRMYEIAQKHKAELQNARSVRRFEQKEKAKTTISKTIDTIKKTTNKTMTTIRRKDNPHE